MLPRLLLGLLAAASLTLAGCAHSPQHLSLQPMVTAQLNPIGQGQPVVVRVVDGRSSPVLGTRGGLYPETSAISVAGQDVPSFSSRKVTTTLRLREGESNLLAGLLRDDQRKILTGFPGLMKVPVLRSLFGQSQDEVTQSDIVMLLTPRIIRTHELTAEDLAPIFIGTQSNVSLGGSTGVVAPVSRLCM